MAMDKQVSSLIALRIYDTGAVYVLMIDPANMPEWVRRWIESAKK
jgi:hypothetical protein